MLNSTQIGMHLRFYNALAEKWAGWLLQIKFNLCRVQFSTSLCLARTHWTHYLFSRCFLIPFLIRSLHLMYRMHFNMPTLRYSMCNNPSLNTHTHMQRCAHTNRLYLHSIHSNSIASPLTAHIRPKTEIYRVVNCHNKRKDVHQKLLQVILLCMPFQQNSEANPSTERGF